MTQEVSFEEQCRILGMDYNTNYLASFITVLYADMMKYVEGQKNKILWSSEKYVDLGWKTYPPFRHE